MATPPNELDLRSTEEDQLLAEGRLLVRQGQTAAALDPLRRALAGWQGNPDRVRSLAECHLEIGYALEQQRPDEALAHEEQALELLQRLQGTEREQAGCLRLIGQALWRL